MTEYLELPLAAIAVGSDRARAIDPAWVAGLAGSIREQGLLQPIVVYADDEGYHLIAGHHRLEAVRLLGRDTISAIMLGATTADEAKLAEVMENLGRHDLIALDRCHHLYELKQVWERLYPQAAGRAAGATAMHKKRATANFADAENAEVFGFSEANADKIGLSARTIRLAVKIWTGLVPTVRGRLAGTDLAHKQTELKALSELTATRQIKVLDAILIPDLPEVGNVAQALAYLDNGTPVPGVDKQFRAVNVAFAKLADDALDMVMSAHADRAIASLKRLGHI